MGEGRAAWSASAGDLQEDAWAGASKHADQHGQPASTFWNKGRWDEAEELEVQVMETSKRVLGPEHPDTLTSMNNLSFTWKAMGKQAEALKL